MVRKNVRESKLDKFRSWVAHIRNASENKIILVETKAAVDELKKYNIDNIIYFKEGYKFLEDLVAKNKEIVLLFNINTRSNSLAERTKDRLRERGAKVNTGFRKFLFVTQMRSISGLSSYLEKQVFMGPRKRIPL